MAGFQMADGAAGGITAEDLPKKRNLLLRRSAISVGFVGRPAVSGGRELWKAFIGTGPSAWMIDETLVSSCAGMPSTNLARLNTHGERRRQVESFIGRSFHRLARVVIMKRADGRTIWEPLSSAEVLRYKVAVEPTAGWGDLEPYTL